MRILCVGMLFFAAAGCVGAASLVKESLFGKIIEKEFEGTKYFYYSPYRSGAEMTLSKPSPALVLIPGKNHDPKVYIERWIEVAEKRGVVLVAPLFKPKDYVLLNPDVPRADLKLFQILESLSAVCPLDRGRFYIYGHGAGAEFALQLLLLHPHRIKRGVGSGAEIYTYPDSKVEFPYGTKLAEEVGEVKFRFVDFVRSNFAVMEGELDTELLADDKKVSQRGKTRIERAKNFLSAMKEFAGQRPKKFGLHLEIVPGATYSPKFYTEPASRYLFEIESPLANHPLH